MALIVPQQQQLMVHDSEDYSVSVNVFDPRMLTPNDEEVMLALAEYKPNTKFKAGDLAFLIDVPQHLAKRGQEWPRVWKIKMILTAWAWDLYSLQRSYGHNMPVEIATSLMRGRAGFTLNKIRTPMIYAHGYPHRRWPDTAAWLPEFLLRRTTESEDNMPWKRVCDRFNTHYLGYDREAKDIAGARYAFDLAPNNYKGGQSTGFAFPEEEALVQRLCFAGLEQMLDDPLIVGATTRVRPIVDRDHPIFANRDTED